MAVDIEKYLYSDTLNQIPTDVQGTSVPALLFANGTTNNRFGDIYLFNNFGVSGGNSITANSSITTHYVENNTAYQDHWAIAPIQYTLTGYIGELIFQPSQNWSNWIEENITDYLAPLSMISPTVSSYVDSAINVTRQIEENYKRYSKYAENLMRTVGNWQGVSVNAKTNQNLLFENLLTLRNNRMLVDVYTPYKTLRNMAMTSIILRQADNSKYRSSIEIGLQEYREVGTITRQASQSEMAGLTQQQRQQEVNHGQAQGQKKELRSTAKQLVLEGKSLITGK